MHRIPSGCCVLFLIFLAACMPGKKSVRKSENFDFKDKSILYEGRIDYSDPGAAILSWPGSKIRVGFRGTKIELLLKDFNGNSYINVLIDGDPNTLRKIRLDSVKKWYLIAENLPEGNHQLEISKATQINKDYQRGFISFFGGKLNKGGSLINVAPVRSRFIEFYGNSITCGHAVEDSSGADLGDARYENNYLSYAAITARHFNATYSCIAESGIGLLAGFRNHVMPEVYNLTNLFKPGSLWNFEKQQPQVVVVNLLQNDQAVIENPASESFKKKFGDQPPDEKTVVHAYSSFISRLRGVYPDAYIICMLGNMAITANGSKWPALVKEACLMVNDAKLLTHFVPYEGTSGHPGIKEQESMAASLIRFINKNISW